MNQTQELNNNVVAIVNYIKDRIFNPVINDDDDDDEYEDQLLNPELEKFIDKLANDHSVYDKFIKDCIVKWYRKRHEFENVPPISNRVIDNFLITHIESINRVIFQKYIPSLKADIDNHKRSYQERINHEYNAKLRNAMNEIKRLHTLKTRKSEKQFKDNDSIRNLKDDDKDRLWKQYISEWTPVKDRSKTTDPKLIDTFSDKLDQYIANHILDDQPITEDQFVQLTRGWNPNDKKPIKEWYQEYRKRFDRRNLNTFTHTHQDINTIGFKSRSKIKALQSIYPNRKSPDNETSSFPLKRNIKQYQLHKVCPRGTYLIDIMFMDKYYYLVAINVNTRYLFVECMNEVISQPNDTDETKESRFRKASKNSRTYIKHLQNIIKDAKNIRYLQGDGEKAFNSIESWSIYTKHGITFKPVPRMKTTVYPKFMKREHESEKTDPMHGSLGIIDRVIRTLRDMAYNMQIGIITPDIMKDLVHQYNNVPHETLSKYAGMKVSPKMVQEDSELEEFIARRICQQNYNVMNRDGFKLKNGTPVKIYNEKDSLMKRRSVIQPGRFTVNGFKNGLYEVINEDDETQMIPRYKLERY